MRTDYYAPLAVVQIVAGIVLGPGVLGRMLPDYYSLVFRPPVIALLNGIAWWAVMVFVCIAGIELDLKTTWRHRGESVTTASLALGVPLLLGAVAAARAAAPEGDAARGQPCAARSISGTTAARFWLNAAASPWRRTMYSGSL